jgi:hypothetical protein
MSLPFQHFHPDPASVPVEQRQLLCRAALFGGVLVASKLTGVEQETAEYLVRRGLLCPKPCLDYRTMQRLPGYALTPEGRAIVAFLVQHGEVG